MIAKPHLSQVEKLDRLLSRHENEWVPLPEVIALGIAAYSRRFEDLRRIYGPQGYAIENKTERGQDGITRSWYRKVRTGFPMANPEPIAAPRAVTRPSERQIRIERFEKQFRPVVESRSTTEPQPDFQLTP
jgi:hypothetical protein